MVPPHDTRLLTRHSHLLRRPSHLGGNSFGAIPSHVRHFNGDHRMRSDVLTPLFFACLAPQKVVVLEEWRVQEEA